MGKLSAWYENVHGGWGFGERDKEGVSILDFAETHELSISNTWFRRDEKRLITYSSGESKSMIDYILVRAEDKKRIKNVKVIAGEEVVKQHKLLVCDIAYEMDKKVKTKWRSKTKIWKLKEEDKRNEYKEKLKLLIFENFETVNDKWNRTKGAMLKAADEVLVVRVASLKENPEKNYFFELKITLEDRIQGGGLKRFFSPLILLTLTLGQ